MKKKLAPEPLTTNSFILSAYLGNPIAADDDRIVTSTDFATGNLAVAAQPDTPRNLTVNLTDANSSVSAGTLTITGKSPDGTTITESCTYAQARTGYVGTRIFASVTSVAIASAAGGAAGVDVVIVGVGNVIGLPSPIEASAAVKHVYLGGTRVASPTIATGKYNSGVNVSASTYNGTKTLQVLYSPAQ